MSKSKKAWFGVKTLYSVTGGGKTSSPVPPAARSAILLEERIVIFLAKNSSEAIKLGEAEAKEYARPTFKNRYGEKIKAKYVGTCEAFELFDKPANGVEVFSSTEVHPNKSAAVKAGKAKIPGAVRNEALLRKRFQHE